MGWYQGGYKKLWAVNNSAVNLCSTETVKVFNVLLASLLVTVEQTEKFLNDAQNIVGKCLLSQIVM